MLFLEFIPKNYCLLGCVINTVSPAPLQNKKILQCHHITVIKTGHYLHATWNHIYIIVEGFKLSESIHGLRYMWMIGDGDSSVHHSILISVPYGQHAQKVECSNHAIKCYRSGLEKLAKESATLKGKNGIILLLRLNK